MRTRTITIESNSKYVRDSLGRFVTHIPQVAKEQTKEIAEIFLESLRKGAPHWGKSPLTIRDSLKVESSEKGYDITLVEHGFLLDAMKYHAAPSGFGRVENPIMKSWLEEHIPGYTLPYIWVKPKPWITSSIADGSAEMRAYVKSGKTELGKYLKSIGR